MNKIFVLEDDKDIREVVSIMLESENYYVVTFANVKEFMERDMSEIPDLYILDVMLPDGSGLEVCEKLRSESEEMNAPIIIMSAHANIEEVESGCSAESFIQKPFDMDLFLEEVRDQIKKGA